MSYQTRNELGDSTCAQPSCVLKKVKVEKDYRRNDQEKGTAGPWGSEGSKLFPKAPGENVHKRQGSGLFMRGKSTGSHRKDDDHSRFKPEPTALNGLVSQAYGQQTRTVSGRKEWRHYHVKKRVRADCLLKEGKRGSVAWVGPSSFPLGVLEPPKEPYRHRGGGHEQKKKPRRGRTMSPVQDTANRHGCTNVRSHESAFLFTQMDGAKGFY